jgi:hypothetical protein
MESPNERRFQALDGSKPDHSRTDPMEMDDVRFFRPYPSSKPLWQEGRRKEIPVSPRIENNG